MGDLLNPDELATRWGTSRAVLAQWRYLGRGPAYVKVGGKRVFYRLSDIADYENSRTVKPGAA
ncbi:helix-turn-helix domain-containing protein [Nocardia sp. NPDC050413]|uniref:helix-turn-helix transcriptional regulator n=1 Tax=Nocardia sp. NPDC050413 TaxID=3155784 RepID=UPI0033D371D7